MNETEPCQIWSIDPPMKIGEGSLHLSARTGLPRMIGPLAYETPWELPANYQLRPLSCQNPGELLHAWRDIEEIIRRLSIWSRRHDDCGQEAPTQTQEDAQCQNK
jgi:hypothetical protein